MSSPLFLCRARHIVNTPSPQILRCTVDKFSKTDKHQLGHTCNVLIHFCASFFWQCKPGVPTWWWFLIYVQFGTLICFKFARESNFKLMLISVGHVYPRKGASLSSCLFFHFAASLPAFSSPLHNLHVPFMLQSISSSAACCNFIMNYNALTCFNQYQQHPHVVILNLL